MKSNYELVDFKQFYLWIEHRWYIMSSLLQNTTIEKRVIILDDKDIQYYENEYFEFIVSIRTAFIRENYNANKLARFVKSLYHDLDALLYFIDGTVHFYAYEKLKYKIDESALIAFKTNWKNRMSELLKLNTPDNKLLINLITCKYEDIFEQYRTNRLRMSPAMIYDRTTKLGNQNISLLYLLEVHIKNCILTNSTKNFLSSLTNFLMLHSSDIYNMETITNIEKFVNMLSTFQSERKDIFSIYQNSKEYNNKNYQLNYSIIAIANVILAAGDRPLTSFLPVEIIQQSTGLISSLKYYKDFRKYNNHLTHVFDLENLQFSETLVNEYLPKVIIDYGLITNTLSEPIELIQSLLGNKVKFDVSKYLETFQRQFYHVAQVNNKECLLFRSKLIQMFILYITSITN